jgi:hypothetical protein
MSDFRTITMGNGLNTRFFQINVRNVSSIEKVNTITGKFLHYEITMTNGDTFQTETDLVPTHY